MSSPVFKIQGRHPAEVYSFWHWRTPWRKIAENQYYDKIFWLLSFLPFSYILPEILTQSESDHFEEVAETTLKGHSVHFYPLKCAMSVLREMMTDNNNSSNNNASFMALHDLIQEVDKFGNGLGATNIMVWVNFPLAYTQVLTYGGWHLFKKRFRLCGWDSTHKWEAPPYCHKRIVTGKKYNFLLRRNLLSLLLFLLFLLLLFLFS